MVVDSKMIVTNRGYQTSIIDEQMKIAYKSNEDPRPLRQLKARIMCRHETLNARIKDYMMMRETFRHTDEQHEIAFKAILVVIQYELDMGFTNLFEV